MRVVTASKMPKAIDASVFEATTFFTDKYAFDTHFLHEMGVSLRASRGKGKVGKEKGRGTEGP